MKLTREHRLRALEREVVVLQGTLKLLHKMLKEQNARINDFILQRVTRPQETKQAENGHSEDAMYIFVCKQRMERMEQNIKRLQKLMESADYRAKVG
jgi:hypothetical protein